MTKTRVSDPFVSYSGGDPGFERWLRAVDRLCKEEYGLGIWDLPDMQTHDAYEDDVTPDEFFEVDVRDEIEGKRGF